jgi:hypothetical protein
MEPKCRSQCSPVPVPAPAPAPGPVPVTASVPETGSSCGLGNTAQDTPQISTKPKIIDNSSMGMSVARRAQSAPLPKPDDFLSEPLHAVGLGPRRHVKSTSGSGGAFRSRRPCLPAPPARKLLSLAVLSPPHRCPGRCEDGSHSTCATGQTSKPISATPPATGHCGDSPERRENTMKCLTILCLSLALGGCYGTGPYARADDDGPTVDFSACAESADLRVNPLCHPLRRTQPKIAPATR